MSECVISRRQLSKTELNFEVICSTTRPTNPKENTIWINTDIDATGWLFYDFSQYNSNIPIWEEENGFIEINAHAYFQRETSFNLLKQNYIILAPSSAWQYINSKWIHREGQIYLSGKWVDFFSAAINVTYQEGYTCSATDGTTVLYASDTSGTWSCIIPYVGTWTITITNGDKSKSVSVDITENNQTESVSIFCEFSITSNYFNPGLSLSGYNNTSSAVSKFSCTKEAIDLTDFSTLSATLFANSGSIYITLYISTTTSKNNAVASTGMPGPNSSGSSRRIDISRFSGKYYIILEVVCNGYTYDTKTGGAKDIILT